MKNTFENNSAAALYRLFRRLQQRNRFLATDRGTELTPLESFTLLQIDVNPLWTITELAKFFEVDQSTISRVIQRLVRSKLVAVKTKAEDTRVRTLRATAHGQEYCAINDKESNADLKSYFENLTAKEVTRISTYFHQLADACQTPAEILRAHDHPFRSGVRRLTRTFGILKSTIMGSSLSAAQWQVLSEIESNPTAQTPSTIARALGMDLPSLSTILRILKNKGFLTQHAHGRDKRKVLLEVTNEGRQEIEKIMSQAIKQIDRALTVFSSEEKEDFVRIFGKVINEESTSKEALDEKISWRRLSLEEELTKARAFLVESLVQEKRHNCLGPSILPPESACYALYSKGNIQAVLEISFRARRHWISHFAAQHLKQLNTTMMSFLERSLDAYFKEASINQVWIDASCIPARPQDSGTKKPESLKSLYEFIKAHGELRESEWVITNSPLAVRG